MNRITPVITVLLFAGFSSGVVAGTPAFLFIPVGSQLSGTLLNGAICNGFGAPVMIKVPASDVTDVNGKVIPTGPLTLNATCSIAPPYDRDAPPRVRVQVTAGYTGNTGPYANRTIDIQGYAVDPKDGLAGIATDAAGSRHSRHVGTIDLAPGKRVVLVTHGHFNWNAINSAQDVELKPGTAVRILVSAPGRMGGPGYLPPQM